MLKEKKGEVQIVLNNMSPGDGGSPKSIKKGSIAQITAMSSPRKQSDMSSLGGQFNRSFQKRTQNIGFTDGALALGMNIPTVTIDKSQLRTHDEGHSIEDLVKLNLTQNQAYFDKIAW